MGFDVASFNAILSAVSNILTTVKQIKELWPSGKKEKELAEALKQLEQAAKQIELEKVRMLQGVGYEICYNHPMPAIMQSEDRITWKCTVCECTRNTGAATAVGSRSRRDTRKSSWNND